MSITYHNTPLQSKMLDYAVNIYKDGVFVQCIRYQNYSGTAVHDEVKFLRYEYPKSEGYDIRW